MTSTPRRLSGIIGLCLAVGIAVGALFAPPPKDAAAMARVLGPPSTGPVVGDLAVTADSITIRARWARSANSLGAATGYAVTVTDSATGTIIAQFQTADTVVTHTIARPAVGQARALRVEVVAQRRGFSSSPAVGYARFETPDAPPPMPAPVLIDTLPDEIVGIEILSHDDIGRSFAPNEDSTQLGVAETVQLCLAVQLKRGGWVLYPEEPSLAECAEIARASGVRVPSPGEVDRWLVPTDVGLVPVLEAPPVVRRVAAGA